MAEGNFEVRMPLFDRLVDEGRLERGDPAAMERDRFTHREARPLRTLDRAGLRESVRRELEQLFNTRCPVPAHQLAERPRSVIDYGIPDFSSFSPRNFNDRQRLAGILCKAIEIYEPRLSNVRVAVEPMPGDDMALLGAIEASVVVEGVSEPLSFETVLQLKEGSVAIRENS